MKVKTNPVKIIIFVLGYFYPKIWLFEFQVKQTKKLGHFDPFVFTVKIKWRCKYCGQNDHT